MIKISRIKLGIIRARAQFIADYAYDDSIKVVAELIVKDVEKVEQDEEIAWKEMLSHAPSIHSSL